MHRSFIQRRTRNVEQYEDDKSKPTDWYDVRHADTGAGV